MTHIDRAIAQLERWIESIQQEKDRLAVEMRDPRATEIRWGFIAARLAYLDVALGDARELLVDLRSKQYRPELMFVRRPLPPLTLSMVKMKPKAAARERRRA